MKILPKNHSIQGVVAIDSIVNNKAQVELEKLTVLQENKSQPVMTGFIHKQLKNTENIMITKLIIAGGRDFFDRGIIHQTIIELLTNKVIDLDWKLICGMAKGADLTAFELYGALPKHKFFPDWKTSRYGRYNALRNDAMALVADGLVAFWDGKSEGTRDMIETMERWDKPVYAYDYQGLL